MVGQLFSDGRLEAEGRPLFVLQQGFMAFSTMVSFQAIAYVAGPHSWVVSQWREFYNMEMPMLLPHRQDLLCRARTWIKRLWNDLRNVPSENWMPQQRFWSQRHPFSPMPLHFQGAEFVKSHMYWSQWLEFFLWPHVQFYQGLPDLILKATGLNFERISKRMLESNKEAVRNAHGFWIDILPVLLPTHPR